MSRVFNEKKRFPRWLPIGMFLSMRIAFKNLFRPAITVRYPHVRSHIPERARWAVEIAYAEDGTHRCTACRICERECPNFLIDLDIETSEDRSKLIKSWYYRRGGCMMCGLCVEACPFDAIKMGHDYELAHVSPDLLEYELLSNSPAYKKPRPARPAAKAASATDAATSGTTATARGTTARGTTAQKEASDA